jgi:hypothetical protein
VTAPTEKVHREEQRGEREGRRRRKKERGGSRAAE